MTPESPNAAGSTRSSTPASSPPTGSAAHSGAGGVSSATMPSFYGHLFVSASSRADLSAAGYVVGRCSSCSRNHTDSTAVTPGSAAMTRSVMPSHSGTIWS